MIGSWSATLRRCSVGSRLGSLISSSPRTRSFMSATSDGLFAFSVETCEGDGFKLEPTMRFAHSRSYVEATAREVGLRPLLIRSASTRREAGADAPGLICVFEGRGG